MALTAAKSKFNFYHQIRLLLRKLRDGKTSDVALLDKKILITSTLSLDAPSGEVKSLKEDISNSQFRVTAWYNGLTGSMGALPTAYSEWMIERRYRYGDNSAKAFIDLFGHRLYCLDYLAWQKNHPFALAEAENTPPLNNVLLAMAGLLNSPPPLISTRHLSLFASPVRSMVNLEQWLTQKFDVAVQIVPFRGGWRTVEKSDSCQLGNCRQRLDKAPMLGTARIEIDSSFEVVFGPMSITASYSFLPKGRLWYALWPSIRNYVGPLMSFSVLLLINSRESESSSLGEQILGINFILGTGTNYTPQSYKVRLQEPSYNLDS